MRPLLPPPRHPPHLPIVIIIAVVVFITALTFASVPSRCCVWVLEMSQPFLSLSIQPTTKVTTSIYSRHRGSFNGAPPKSSFENSLSFFFFSFHAGLRSIFFFFSLACQGLRNVTVASATLWLSHRSRRRGASLRFVWGNARPRRPSWAVWGATHPEFAAILSALNSNSLSAACVIDVPADCYGPLVDARGGIGNLASLFNAFPSSMSLINISLVS